MTSIIKIGTSVGTLTTLDALSTPVHDPAAVTFYPYSEVLRTVDGASTSRGKPYCTLYWKVITRTQRDMLRTYCTGTFALVYFTLPTNDSNLTVANYTGDMTWPLTEKYYNRDLITDFTIPIYNLVAL